MAAKYTKVNIRKSHPTLYHAIMTLALARVALALNFWFSRPTFTPYGIHRYIAGIVFFALGASQLLFLHLLRDLRKIRLVINLSGGVMLLWGLVNMQQSFQGKASFQLPIMFVMAAVLQYVLLIEPPVNPMSERK